MTAGFWGIQDTSERDKNNCIYDVREEFAAE